jgi:hypothetical protein
MKKIFGGELSFVDSDDTILPAGASLALSDLQGTEHSFPKSMFDGQSSGATFSSFSFLPLEPHANGAFTAHNDEQSLALVSTHEVGPQASTFVDSLITADQTQAGISAHLGTPGDPQGDIEMGDVELDDQEVPYFVGFDPTSPAGQLEAQTPALGTSFNTITRQQAGFIPPDPIGAAGPNHLVDAVNANIQFYTKSGVQQYSQTLDTFFGQSSSHFLFDPKVLYDNSAGRFLVVADEVAGTGTNTNADDVSRIHVAVSDDSDPNGTWYSFSFNSLLSDGTNNYWGDYPTVGVDEQAIYVSENFFPTESSGNAVSRMWIIPKANFYSTGATPTVTFTNPNAATGLGFDVFTWQPAQVIGDINGATTGTYLVGYSGLHFTSGPNSGQEVVEVLRVDSPLSATPTFTASQILVGDISSNVHVDAPQSGSGTAINTGDERALQALWYNNHLYATTTVNPGNGQATAHWFDFNASGVGAATLAQQGNIDGEDIAPGTSTFFPSVAVNTQGTVAFGFAASGPSIFAGSYFTQHTAADASGTVENSQVLRAGLDSYARVDNIGRNRWGDYTGISVDPSDNSFWVFNENALAKGTGTGEWGTAWGNFGGSPAGSIAINDMSISEGDSGSKLMTFTVTRTGGTGAFAVNFATADGSATVADHDYVANAGTLNFGVGVNTQQIQVTITGDLRFEFDETFAVNLSGATNGATIADSQGIGTIINDDPLFAPSSFKLANFAPDAGGWVNDTTYPRELADVNGDGSADIVGFGEGGVYVALATGGGSFGPASFKLANFGPSAGGWVSNNTYPRELADVNGDHLADIVGFGDGGVYVALATGGGSFGPSSFKLANFAPSAGGWVNDTSYPRELADVNGDGMADIVGFGDGGVYVALATGGGSFGASSFKLANFGPSAGGWTSNDKFPRFVADVNGDHMADIVGFGEGGVYVALATGGGSFGPSSFKLANFAPSAGGWINENTYPRELADVNSDGMADIVGFGDGGVYVAFATGGGSFGPSSFQLANFGPSAGGWTSDNIYPRLLADINNDGAADIVGFGQSGVYDALSNGFHFV